MQAVPGGETQRGRGVTVLDRLMNQLSSLFPQAQQRTASRSHKLPGTLHSVMDASARSLVTLPGGLPDAGDHRGDVLHGVALPPAERFTA
jgi:hypothetical protein